DIHELLDAARQFLGLLHTHRLGNRDHDANGGFDVVSFLLRILRHQEDAVGDGRDERGGRRLEPSEGFAITGVVHMKGYWRPALRLVAIKDHVQPKSFYDLFKKNPGRSL